MFLKSAQSFSSVGLFSTGKAPTVVPYAFEPPPPTNLPPPPSFLPTTLAWLRVGQLVKSKSKVLTTLMIAAGSTVFIKTTLPPRADYLICPFIYMNDRSVLGIGSLETFNRQYSYL